MDDSATNRCGYTWPEDYEAGDDPGRREPRHQSCCFRETLSDTDRCAWHADPDDTDEKTVQTLRDGRVDADTRRQTDVGAPDSIFTAVELLDGANLSGLELEDGLSLNRVALREADLSDVDLTNADLSSTYMLNADLSDAYLVNADLSDAYLYKADLTDAYLVNSDLRGADLTRADLTNAYLSNSDLTNADLSVADLTDADLFDADLIDTNFEGANLTDVNLERATLLGTNLSNTDLTGIRPYGARITDVEIDYRTDLHTNRSEYASWWQRGGLQPAPRCGYDLELREGSTNEDTDREELLTKAADTYTKLEKLAGNNSRPSLERSMVIRRKEMEKKLHRTRKERSHHARAVISGIVFNYGESLRRVLLWWLLVITAYSAVYAQSDLIRDGAGGFMRTPAETLYFSTLTFITIGIGDFQPEPASELAQQLVTSQAAFAAVLIALFVFVLGRRTAR